MKFKSIISDPSQLDNFFMPSDGKKKRFKKVQFRFLPTLKQLRYLPKVLSTKERYLILVFALIAIIGLIATPISAYYHFTTKVADYGNSFSEGMVGSPKYINPLLAQTSDVDRDLSKLIYTGLMKYDNIGNLTYGLTKSHSISGDGLTYTFKLRDNLKWHDGNPINADDVIFTILSAQNSDYGNFQRIYWQGVEVSKIDDLTIIFKLKNIYAQFLSNLTLGILPKHLWENVKPASFSLSELNLKPIGSGPYKFSKVTKDSSGNIISFELSAFENFYEATPFISKITFIFYASEDKMINGFNQGKVDGLSYISPQKLNAIRFPGRLYLRELRLPRYFALFLNQSQSKQLSDKNVRLALNYATDKKLIIDKILLGKGIRADSPMLPGIIGVSNPTDIISTNLDKARQILDDAGWKYSDELKIRQKLPPPVKGSTKSTAAKTTEKPVEATKLEIKLTTSNWPELVAVANELKFQWEKIGVSVGIETLALPELEQVIKDRSYESLLFGEVLGLDPNPYSFWHSSQKRDPGLNLALYDNKDADKILEDARQTLDTPKRLSKYADFQKIVINDASAIFIYSPYYLYAQSKKINGNEAQIISIPSDRFESINKWYIKTKRVFNNK